MQRNIRTIYQELRRGAFFRATLSHHAFMLSQASFYILQWAEVSGAACVERAQPCLLWALRRFPDTHKHRPSNSHFKLIINTSLFERGKHLKTQLQSAPGCNSQGLVYVVRCFFVWLPGRVQADTCRSTIGYVVSASPLASLAGF